MLPKRLRRMHAASARAAPGRLRVTQGSGWLPRLQCSAQNKAILVCLTASSACLPVLRGPKLISTAWPLQSRSR